MRPEVLAHALISLGVIGLLAFVFALVCGVFA